MRQVLEIRIIGNWYLERDWMTRDYKEMFKWIDS